MAGMIAGVWRGLALVALLLVLMTGAVAKLYGNPKETAVTRCREDLAQRLNLPPAEVALVEAQPRQLIVDELGMPTSIRVYFTAPQVVPAWRVVLEAKNTRYLYTASEKACKYGGPLALWDVSMLYVEPAANEPNLNGNLYQCSLAGTNPVCLTSGVSDAYPQAQGMILFTRRTSRSGFELWMMKAGKGEQGQQLHAAFAYGGAALNEKQDTWAAFVRPGVGMEWQVTVARVGQQPTVTLPLPEGVQPQQIIWIGDQVAILVSKGMGTGCFQMLPTADAPAWSPLPKYDFPGAMDYVLSKSDSLEIVQAGPAEAPRVEVADIWFTGDRNIVATLNGLTLRGSKILGNGYVFVWGEKDGQSTAYTVRIATGEVTPGYTGKGQGLQTFNSPPLSQP